MRIQHNIMALNAYRQLGGNNSALAKNLEKLSSGYAINRAGDDAAGLAISEKMRAQIKGLEAAQKNANDGISLVQTAEGALTEVHSMLNRMVYMATQSANGTYDNEVDRANLDAELQTLKEEIDRISKSTNFNGLKLLDGSMDASASTSTGGATDVPILQNVATDPTAEVGNATVLHKDAPDEGKTEITVELHNLSVTGQDGDVFKLSVGDAKIELKFKEGADGTVPGEIAANTTLKGDDLVDALIAAFNAGDKMIGGQEFGVEASGTGLKFTQAAEPETQTQVVDANVKVKAELTPKSPDMKEYSVAIDGTLSGANNTSITIGNDTVEIDAAKTIAEQFNDEVTVGGYKVKWDADKSKLMITDPKGGDAPKVSYQTYGATGTALTATSTAGAAATNATAAGAATGLTLADTQTLKVGDDTLTLAAATHLTNGATASTANYDLTFNQNADGTTWDVTVAIKSGGGKEGADGNGTIAVGVGTATKDVTFAGGTDDTYGIAAFDLSNLKAGDKLEIGSGGSAETIIIEGSVAETMAKAENITKIQNAMGAGTASFDTTSGVLSLKSANAGAGNAAPTTAISLFENQGKEMTVSETGKASVATGTYNVQSTVTRQGAPEGAGQLASTAFDLTTDLVKDGATLTIGKETYTFKVGKDSTVPDSAQNIIDLSKFEEGDEDLLHNAALQLANQQQDAFTIGYAKDNSGKITIHEKEGQTVFTKGELESVEEFDKLVYAKTPVVETKGKALTFQVGDTADDYQKVALNIKDMSSAGLGIADISIGDIDSATDAIAKIKDAINLVSSQRGDLGAIQNRLEHTINNLGVQTENITAAESRIRDTDMAEEMMAYTKNNILVQAAQAMLAQANQVPQGILQLLQ